MHTAFATLAERSRGAAAGVYEYFSLAARATRALFSRPFYGRDILIQLDRIGVASLPIMALTGLVAGLVLALQSEDELERFGALNYMGNIVGASMVREIGPVMGSLAFAGRVASGIAAELGSMRVTEQIDALQSFGTDPIKKTRQTPPPRRHHHAPRPHHPHGPDRHPRRHAHGPRRRRRPR